MPCHISFPRCACEYRNWLNVYVSVCPIDNLFFLCPLKNICRARFVVMYDDRSKAPKFLRRNRGVVFAYYGYFLPTTSLIYPPKSHYRNRSAASSENRAWTSLFRNSEILTRNVVICWEFFSQRYIRVFVWIRSYSLCSLIEKLKYIRLKAILREIRVGIDGELAGRWVPTTENSRRSGCIYLFATRLKHCESFAIFSVYFYPPPSFVFEFYNVWSAVFGFILP